MENKTKDIFKDWKNKRNFYLEDGETSERFYNNLVKNALVYSYDKARKEIIEEVEKIIDWYNKDLDKHIKETKVTESYKITDGEMATIIMTKCKLLLEDIEIKIKQLNLNNGTTNN